MYKYFFKRFFDLVLSFITIIILLPFFILFTPVVALKMKGNPFFIQRRPGINCRIFKMIKYRTMTNEKDSDGNLLPDDKRLTKFGKLMRKLSIDELPEFLNVLKGDMSLVGPRPLLIKDMWFFDDEIKRRQNVRPGITGLAQVSGRNGIGWDEKFEYDLKYIKKIRLFKDIKILILTVFKVFKSEGVVREGTETDMDYGDWLVFKNIISKEKHVEIVEGRER